MNPLAGNGMAHHNALAATMPRQTNAMLPGWEVAGNIDLMARPVVRNPDGSISTVRSMSINVDGLEYLIPTVSDDGRIMTDDEAMETFFKSGRHLGAFRSIEAADRYANRLHDQQASQYGDR